MFSRLRFELRQQLRSLTAEHGFTRHGSVLGCTVPRDAPGCLFMSLYVAQLMDEISLFEFSFLL